MILRGHTAGGSPAITVRWDSGAGFNDYEQRLFQPDVHPQDGQISVVIGTTGRKNSASSSAGAVCSAVLVDGTEIKLDEFAKPPVFADGELHLQEQSSLAFKLPAQSHVAFRFHTDSNSGVAFVEVNGKRTEFDLYMANVEAKFKQFDYWLLQPDGSFALTVDLPRYPVRLLELSTGNASLTAVELHGKGQIANLLQNKRAEHGKIRFEQPLEGMHSFFHPLQFAQQIFFALFSTWLLTSLFRLAQEIGGLRSMFLREQRPWFWLMFATSLTVLGAWLAAFWPGVMSVDSMKIWRAALLPDVYLNDHPLLNVILYKYLRHIWSNPAVVSVSQVVVTSLLLAWSGLWLLRRGVAIQITLCWLLLVLGAVPVCVYTTALWKDIPFAVLIVCWAVTLAKLRQAEKENRLRWTKQRGAALLLLGLAVGLIRHNGIVYLAVLPVLLLLLRLVPLKKALPVLAILVLTTAIGFVALRQSAHNQHEGFFTKTVRWYAGMVQVSSISNDLKRTARDYLTVLDIDAPQADKFHYYMHDRQAWWFLLHSGWWDVYPYQQSKPVFPQLRNTAMQLYEWSYTKPWLWLMWNPVWLLALLPLLTLCFRWLPNTGILGAMLLAGALPLVYLQIFNWRYYYFLYFGLLFLPAFVLLDFQQWRTDNPKQNA
ncbi:hypothetical protein [Candidatus Electronema sp. JM]|uniref:hypothetical protein n=1 Tax=Candidatus Electronema sp. JM TaxID=3401571 RepID=UPI003AA8F022